MFYTIHWFTLLSSLNEKENPTESKTETSFSVLPSYRQASAFDSPPFHDPPFFFLMIFYFDFILNCSLLPARLKSKIKLSKKFALGRASLSIYLKSKKYILGPKFFHSSSKITLCLPALTPCLAPKVAPPFLSFLFYPFFLSAGSRHCSFSKANNWIFSMPVRFYSELSSCALALSRNHRLIHFFLNSKLLGFAIESGRTTMGGCAHWNRKYQHLGPSLRPR